MDVLVTGASGYVASRLIPVLLDREHEVRVTSRHPEDAARRHAGVTAVPSDLFDESSLDKALAGIEVAYYLAHSMAGEDFEKRDREAARNFLGAAEKAGVRRIIYLGGLGREQDRLSRHLKSRQEVGQILASGDVEVIELRAAIVVGSGSAGFEMIRHLSERLPVMIAPRWLGTRIQPVAEKDLVAFLTDAAEISVSESRVIELGGPDVLTYKQMILGYSRVRGLKRRIVGVPVLTPKLSSYWVDLITPVPSSVARPLIDGLKNEVVVQDSSARLAFDRTPDTGYEEGARDALESQVRYLSAATDPDTPEPPGALEGVIQKPHWVRSRVYPERMAKEIFSIGGSSRWYPLRWTWWVRARLDSLFGGRGLRWEKPDGPLQRGSRVDWWTVEEISGDRLLLRAEMKTPGEAWLEWRVLEAKEGCELRQTAFFRPRGILGRMYWWGLLPFHSPIFRLMAVRIAQRAETGELPPGLGRWRWWAARRRSSG